MSIAYLILRTMSNFINLAWINVAKHKDTAQNHIVEKELDAPEEKLVLLLSLWWPSTSRTKEKTTK